jgi:hypothetical protein
MPQQIPDEILFDVRLQERHIRRGLLTRDQVEKHRDKNADMTDQADILDLDQLAQKQNQPKR